MEHFSNDDWVHWFPSETAAWRDFYDQAAQQPKIRDALAFTFTRYQQAKHPRDLHEPWYVDPADPPKAAEKPRAGFLEQSRAEAEQSGPRTTDEERRARVAEYFKLVGVAPPSQRKKAP